jgi:hypothetical protein
MCSRKFRIWSMVAVFCILVMVISCDTDEVSTDKVSIGEHQIPTPQTNSTGITINVSLEEDIGVSALPLTTIYKVGNPTSVTIEAAKGISCQWFVDGKLCGTNIGITLDSANLTTGDHFITLISSKNGIPYSKEFIITVIRQFR